MRKTISWNNRSIVEKPFINQRENPTEELKPVEEIINISSFRLTIPIDNNEKKPSDQECKREES